MKLKSIFKGMWDIHIAQNDYICCFVKSIQRIDRVSGETKSMLKIKEDYYATIEFCSERNYLIGLSLIGNCIDIYNATTLQLIHSFKWKGEKTFERQHIIYYSHIENCIYSLLYSFPDYDPEVESYVSRISLEDMKEEIVLQLKGCYAFDIKYNAKMEDIFICFKHFNPRPNPEALGIYKGVWLYHLENIIFEEANKKYNGLEEIWFTKQGEIFYVLDVNGEKSLRLPKRKNLIKNIETAAISDNKKLFAYIKKKKLYLYSLDQMKVLKKMDIRYKYATLIEMKFLGNDFLYYADADEELYLYVL